jgi:hypothetical protein
MINLTNEETLMVDGRQYVLTGDYIFIGHVTENMIAVQCPETKQVYIIKNK